MLDPIFDGISWLLNLFYSATSNYALAIALLTCALMLITTPLTMKSTRSMIEMQRLQPEIRKLQVQYKDDRQKLNEEMMRFYKEHQINPLGGCLPMLIQAPVFGILFWVIRGLTETANFVGLQGEVVDRIGGGRVVEGFRPKYLNQDDALYQSLLGKTEMRSFGVDLAISPSDALQEGFTTALPYLVLILMVAGLTWVQQKQIMGRNKGSEISPQQKMMMRIMPVMLPVFAFAMPAALGVYFLISTVWRVGQQAYITRSLYGGEDSIGAQAQKAMAEARAERSKQKASGSGNGSAKRSATSGKSGKAAASNGKVSSTKPSQKKPAGAAAGSSGSQNKPHPRSKKKKKRK